MTSRRNRNAPLELISRYYTLVLLAFRPKRFSLVPLSIFFHLVVLGTAECR